MRTRSLTFLALTATALLLLGGCGSSRDSGSTQTVQASTAADPQALFVGSESCQTCHSAIYGDVFESGHPYKLNKVLNGQIPSYPFSTINGALEQIADDNGETDNSLGTPTSYADVSYVIGGFGWKARWIDANGFIVTGSEVQYNLEDGSMVAYHNDEVGKVYNCGNCHTTGWKHFDASLNPNRQDNLPGMDGTFVAGGIQCESCHGPGATHVGSLNKADIVRIAEARTTADFLASDMGYSKAVACSECHTRDGEKDYPAYVSAYNKDFPAGSNEGGRIVAKGGFIKHHEQYDEMLGVDPATGNELGKHIKAGVGCITCHDPHKTMKHQDKTGVTGLKVDCASCHGAGEAFEIAMPADSFMGDFACESCHMPDLTKNAVAHPAVGTGPATGDIATHIFKIDLTKAEQFTADGKFANPWITKDYACGTCHNGVEAFDDSSVAADYIFHKAAVLAADTPAVAGEYAGSEVCAKCHASNYADFAQSGHPYKLNKIVNDSVPTYPFTDLDPTDDGLGFFPTATDGNFFNSLGAPTDYADISYVIGGYGWKARWIDLDGFIVTSDTNQYNFEDGSWGAYHPTDVDKPYNCGNCHTTGWRAYDATNNPKPADELLGMDGSFVLDGGVHCESCHGAALEHVVTQDAAFVTEVATQRSVAELQAGDSAYNKPVTCGECHTRDGEHNYRTNSYVSPYETDSSAVGTVLGGRIIAKGGLAQHHEQQDELFGVNPANIAGGSTRNNIASAMWKCTTCHDPHTSTKHQNDPANTSGPGVRTACTSCHTMGFNVAAAAHSGTDCITCHMPKLAKSAITTGPNAAGKTLGDIKSHIFTIDVTQTDQILEAADNIPNNAAAKDYMNPWVTPDYACGSCHITPATQVGNLPAEGMHPPMP